MKRVSAELRREVMNRDLWRCRYCMVAQAIHVDHIVPRSLRRRYEGFEGLDFLVASCGSCNWRKMTYRLAPQGFDLALLPGIRPWKHWDGGQIPN